MKKICIFGILLFFFHTSISGYLYAGIGVDPFTLETSAETGKELVGIFRVSNTGDKLIRVSVGFEDWLSSGVEPKTWLKIIPSEFSVNSKEIVEINYVISLLKNTQNSEFMAMVFFNSIEEGSNVGAGFGIPVYVSVKGKEKVEAEITEVNIDFKSEQGIYGFVDIRNKGNVHIRPCTTINIIDNNGKSIGYFSIQYGLPVQAGRTRKYEINNPEIKLISGKKYEVIATSDYGNLYKLEKRTIKKFKFKYEARKNEKKKKK